MEFYALPWLGILSVGLSALGWFIRSVLAEQKTVAEAVGKLQTTVAVERTNRRAGVEAIQEMRADIKDLHKLTTEIKIQLAKGN
jgi:translation initiation factor 1 (eIF-1/SUI1)